MEIKFDDKNYNVLEEWANSNDLLTPMIFKGRNSNDWGIEIMEDGSNIPVILTLGKTIDSAIEKAIMRIQSTNWRTRKPLSEAFDLLH